MNYCVKHQQVYEERCYQCDEYNEKDRPVPAHDPNDEMHKVFGKCFGCKQTTPFYCNPLEHVNKPEQGEHEQKNDENDPIEETRASDAPYGGYVPYSTGTVCAECGMQECMCHEGEPVEREKEEKRPTEISLDVKVPDTRTSKKQWTPERRAKFRETFRLKREAKAKGLQDPQTGFIKKESEEKELDFLHDFQCWDCAYRFKNINEDASKVTCPNCGGADITKGTIAESKDN